MCVCCIYTFTQVHFLSQVGFKGSELDCLLLSLLNLNEHFIRQEERAAAKRKHISPSPSPDHDSDSGEDTDFEYVLEHLDAEGMQNDPEVKNEKKKIGEKKKRKTLQGLLDHAKKSKEVKALKKVLGWHLGITLLVAAVVCSWCRVCLVFTVSFA